MIRAPVAESNDDFVLKKVKRTALNAIKTLDASKENQDFFRDFKDLEDSRYRDQVREAKDEILDSIRNEVFGKPRTAAFWEVRRQRKGVLSLRYFCMA